MSVVRNKWLFILFIQTRTNLQRLFSKLILTEMEPGTNLAFAHSVIRWSKEIIKLLLKKKVISYL